MKQLSYKATFPPKECYGNTATAQTGHHHQMMNVCKVLMPALPLSHPPALGDPLV